MPLTGTAKPPKATKKPAANLVQSVLDQLDSEWNTLKLDDPAIHGEDAGLLAYFHTCVRCLIQQVGDPYTAQFPDGYKISERLPKLCAYLISCQALEGQPLKEARERNLAGLRAAWPAYRDLVQVDIPNGESPLSLEVLPFSWEAIEQNWHGEDDDDNRTKFLPTFATQASADFHLAGLAVLLLNRQCRYYLTDLKPHQTHDGNG